jgi:hypothetical protein
MSEPRHLSETHVDFGGSAHKAERGVRCYPESRWGNLHIDLDSNELLPSSYPMPLHL